MPAPSLALVFHALRTWCELINSCCVQGDVCVCVFLPEQSSRLVLNFKMERGTSLETLAGKGLILR